MICRKSMSSIQAFTTRQCYVAATKYKVQEKIQEIHKVQEEMPLY